jgi:DNA-binding MarR family transcriptional regulator
MERAGLIERGPHPTDRRKRLLHTRPEAAKVVSGMFEQMGRIVDPAADVSRPAVLAFLAAAADALRDAADQDQTLA